jgi:hypothetical protein
MTCQPVSSDAQPARIRLTSARDWFGSVDETLAAGLSLALTPDNVQNRCAADARPCCGLKVTRGGRRGQEVRLNRNVVNGSEPMLRLIGGRPAGTAVAVESAFGNGRTAHSGACSSVRNS